MYIVTNYHLKPLSPHIRHTAFVRKLLFFLVNIGVFVTSQLKLFRFQEPFWMKKKNAYLEYI